MILFFFRFFFCLLCSSTTFVNKICLWIYSSSLYCISGNWFRFALQ